MAGKEYRQNAHVVSLVAWAVLCVIVAVVLFVHARELVDRDLRFAEFLGGLALLVFGPVAFAIYLIRAETLFVAVDPDRGIVIRNRIVIPWDEIERIERRRPKFRKQAGPAQAPKYGEVFGDAGGCAGDLGGGCVGSGQGGGAIVVLLLVAVAVTVAIWLIFFVFIPLLIIPVIEVFSPWGDRVKIVTKKKRKLVLRDLRDADGLLEEVGDRVPVLGR